ncbi:methionyl-tRNA formyltransferase [Microbacterium sp. AISO3]|jgi:methionyl-tRNA formyltransferase|uniref:Methionyl-tRNA formyltransferase n=1 Tax=Microbacterium arborescens TaxID=33883 RepID=A0ABX2WFT9_9MICO|nr:MULTISPECIES: methionyl-tRNA formyltransferase [Microbacterium]APF33212.1 methionyl-tRNA formyltransferase [Microbacterium paludicola]OAZ39548.1 methionyl-tRNA formyltransferase [Microbacterium arborescens]OWP22977.1 methionyl-tRNA formyltransferase [Microbacterium sp. AISO3]QCR40484.1 methionyl-tRNA formyltransferase [Microbacterium sp. SGAir0570]
MRIVFAGTPEPALPSLRRLAASRHEIVGVVTRRDAPLGRKRVLTPSPVGSLAAELGLPVLKTDRLDAEATETITSWGADLGVIVAYGGLVREPLLSAPLHGWINLHFSLLPAWRGAAPVQHSLIAGDRVSGVSVFQLVPELDAGDVFAQTRHPVDRGATAGDLLAALADLGADTLADVVDAIADGAANAVPQAGEASLAPKLTLADGLLDFALPADTVLDRFRGTTPEPGAHTTIAGQRLKVLAARRGPDAPLAPREIRLVGKDVLVGTADGTISLLSVQPAGRGAMPAPDWWRGLRAESIEAGS